ncbi:MAG: hypothetical protein HFH59_05430 [Lachnospiraceae bacterium]|jgi:hypothetical protein|nr:hypothetical protein [Lachnospiraceae bacterium]MCI9356974.1 hypothetical protein [Lachnospiraceae bacterium]
MSYRIQKVESDNVFERSMGYEYALVYMISEMLLCKTSELPKVNWEECLEARFFSKDKELHIYEEDEEWKAVEVTEENERDCLVRRYQLANRFKSLGALLCVHEYLDYDDDGQAMVSLTRLAGIEEV